MATNVILAMPNLIECAQGGRYCSSAEDLVQISLYSNLIQSKEVSNSIIQNYLVKVYQHPDILFQNYKSKFLK